jgi:hypothetical protein
MAKKATQRFLGRNQLVARLAAQVGDRKTAEAILKKRGQMDSKGNLTEKGKARDRMTAGERAIDRESKRSGNPKTKYVYNKKTNRATLRTRKK